jgi:hypothetical protein
MLGVWTILNLSQLCIRLWNLAMVKWVLWDLCLLLLTPTGRVAEVGLLWQD